MTPLGIEEARNRLLSMVGETVYVHLEVNPEAYIRNVPCKLKDVAVMGDHAYRVHLVLTDPDGLLSISGVTDFVDDGDAIVITGFDTQSRIRQTLTVSRRLLAM
ncbi:hypothetical protein SD51_03675 [Alicyclobacillus tengchongensis]|nr:hypothetical protein SD51_03675 [Alicyclobacillus tengchongensis]